MKNKNMDAILLECASECSELPKDYAPYKCFLSIDSGVRCIYMGEVQEEIEFDSNENTYIHKFYFCKKRERC